MRLEEYGLEIHGESVPSQTDKMHKLHQVQTWAEPTEGETE